MEIVMSRNTNLACSRHRLLSAVTLEVIQSEYTCLGETSTVTVFLSYTYRLRFSRFTMDTSTSDDKSADNVDDTSSAATSDAQAEDSLAEDVQPVQPHPWPYLASMFKFVSASEKTYKFKCLLCAPKPTECSAFHNSPSNLKKHVERIHPKHVDAYIKLVECARKRKADSAGDGGKKWKQQRITSSYAHGNANMVCQAAVDQAIVNLIVGAVLPLRLVEVDEFVALITTLQPNRHVISRSTLRNRITEEAKKMKERLSYVLKDQSCVATTTDCWSAYIVYWRYSALVGHCNAAAQICLFGSTPDERKAHLRRDCIDVGRYPRGVWH